jgi:TatD DNase family protein
MQNTIECPVLKLFDAHTHIDMDHYQNDLDKVLLRARTAGIVGIVTSSMGPGSFRRTLGIVKKYRDFVFHSAGCSVSQLKQDDASKIVGLIQRYSKDIVAVGEVGLDYYWIKDTQSREAQEPLFSKFIDVAMELELPIVIHSRKAEERATDILEHQFSGPVLMHCFDGPAEVAKRVANNGWFITLPANFDKYRNRVSSARILPLEQILLETDGPYLSPTTERNEPANIRFGCDTLSKILDIPVNEIAEVTTRNAKRFYHL